MGTPSEQLAERIIERLVAEKLISSDYRKIIIGNLIAGTLKEEDWRIYVEKPLMKNEKGEDNESIN